MKNHLFIGLGGQGGNSLAALRKVVESRENDVTSLKQRQTNWDYLYIDTSDNIKRVNHTWTHFGKDLSLPNSSFLHLNQKAAKIDVDTVAMLPSIAPWIGDKKVLKGFLSGTQEIVGANQRRRLGRVLFALESAKIQQACKQKISDMMPSSASCAIHIFASIAGGTGSGCLIDLVTTLRKIYPNADTDNGFPIFLYLYATSNSYPESMVGYFHENQASVLRDLNALVCGNYHPHLLDSASAGVRFTGQKPVTQIMLSSHLTSVNQELSLEQQHYIMAEACFERIFCYAENNLSSNQRQGLTGEDKITTWSGEPLANPTRSYRFGTFGMRRWEVPIEQIRELLAVNLAHNCLKELLYCNWSDRVGYTDLKLKHTIPGMLDSVMQLLLLVENETSEKLDYNKNIVEFEKDVEAYCSGLKKKSPSKISLDDFEDGVKERYYNHMHLKGVDGLIQEIQSQRVDKIRKIINSINKSLLEIWKNYANPIGLAYFHKIISDLQEKIKSTLQNKVSTNSSNVTHEDRIKLRKTEWRKITFISRPFRRDALIDAQVQDLVSDLKQDFRNRCTSEDSAMLNELQQMLATMTVDYKRASDEIVAIAKQYERKKDQFLQDLSNIADNGNVSGYTNRVEIKIQDVLSHISSQNLEKNSIHNATTIIQQSIISVLNDTGIASLSRLRPDDKYQIIKDIDHSVFDQSIIVHDRICDTKSYEGILSGSILSILEQKYHSNRKQFTNELERFLKSAASTIAINTDDKSYSPRTYLRNNNIPSMPSQAVVIGLPANHTFARVLQNEIEPLIDAGSSEIRFVYTHEDPTQIRMLSWTYWMPARYASVVHELQATYQQSADNDTANDVRYFTNLEDNPPLSDLLMPDPAKLMSQVKAALWLGEKLSVPNTSEPLIQTTSNGIVLVKKAQIGVEFILLGNSYEALLDNTDFLTAETLKTGVSKAVELSSKQLIHDLKEKITHVDELLRKEKGSGCTEYSDWIVLRNEILTFLPK